MKKFVLLALALAFLPACEKHPVENLYKLKHKSAEKSEGGEKEAAK